MMTMPDDDSIVERPDCYGIGNDPVNCDVCRFYIECFKALKERRRYAFKELVGVEP